MSLADKMRFRTGAVSDAVYMEIIAALYGTLVPIVFMGIGQLIVGTITVRETGDMATAVLTALGVVVAFVRAFDVLAYRRRFAGKTPLDRAEAAALGVALRGRNRNDGLDPRFVRRAQPPAQ